MSVRADATGSQIAGCAIADRVIASLAREFRIRLSSLMKANESAQFRAMSLFKGNKKGVMRGIDCEDREDRLISREPRAYG